VPSAADMERKLRRRLAVMPETYKEVGVPEIQDKVHRIIDATEMLRNYGILSLLNSKDIVGYERVAYLNFARILYRLKQRYSDTALSNQARRELEAYLTRYPFLRKDILEEIMRKVLSPAPQQQTQQRTPSGT
jgi:wobble nucleotide-excising tRNase